MNKKEFGPLYAKASNNKVKVWSATVIDNMFYCTHGYLDGKKITDEKEIKSKNIGRANETTPFEQACNDAQSKMNKKIDEGYMTNLDDVAETSIELPMLALNFKDRSHDIVYPAYVSPKLDGFRLVTRQTEDNVEYVSRKGKIYTCLKHLDDYIEVLLNEIHVGDGEAFNPDLPLQEISAAIKKENESTEDIQYWLFDIIDLKQIFEQRYKKITQFFDIHSDGVNVYGFRKYGPIVEVPNYEVNNLEELEAWHKKFTELGFEGTMVRNKAGLYVLKHRSKDLQKRKDFLESEFKIVGGKSATGNDIGTVVFRCITETGKEFDVRPKGSRQKRREWLKDIDSLIGKMLTCRYQLVSNDGIPCQARGIVIRDYE
jgi:ATP-dependent DNA ligase